MPKGAAAMKPIFLAILVIGFAGACPAAPTEAPVAVKTDHLPPHVAERVKRTAAQGPAALQRYVAITRGIYNLELQALAVPVEDFAPGIAAQARKPPRAAREGTAKTP